MAKYQGKHFVLQTRHLGVAEISFPGKGSDYERLEGWKNSPGHNQIMLSNEYNIFGCHNDPNYEFSHCIFQKLIGPGEYASCTGELSV